MELTSLEIQRYKRNINVKEIGVLGQKKLKESKVLIVGCGGLGSPAALYLAAAGIGHLGLVDNDVVEISNLQRQILHNTSKLGIPKVESAQESLSKLNNEIEIKTYALKLNLDNFATIAGDYDFILDCTDSLKSKYMVSDGAVSINKPFCHAAVVRFTGQIMTCVPGRSPCYRCIFGEIPEDGVLPDPASLGVIGAMCGIMGSLQALEAIKYLTSCGEILKGYMLTVDGLTLNVKKLRLPKCNKKCPSCGSIQAD
ncbi:MAG: HesA/MoeB/ThiF family protein [Succinatimonas sp.]|nr:HesA/MoeB/ThiF family protein [Succinatimonas sp.]